MKKIEVIRRKLTCKPMKAVKKYVDELPSTSDNASGDPSVRMADGRYILKSSAEKHLYDKYREHSTEIRAKVDASEYGVIVAQRLFARHHAKQPPVRRAHGRTLRDLYLATTQVNFILPDAVESFQKEIFRLAQLRRESRSRPSGNGCRSPSKSFQERK